MRPLCQLFLTGSAPGRYQERDIIGGRGELTISSLNQQGPGLFIHSYPA